MKQQRSYRVIIICALLMVSLFVSGLLTRCSGGGGGGHASGSKGSDQDGGPGYEIPEFRDVSFDGDAGEGTTGADGTSVSIDATHSNEGYFGVLAEGEAKLKLQVVKGEENYVYDLPTGEVQYFPFQLGDGSYSIRVMQNVSGDKYSELYGADVDVALESEFEPFLRTGQYASYTPDSACVHKAHELAEKAADVNDFITGVYEYVCDNVTYDSERAENVASGYIPDPDRVLSEGKGICFDYASLAASMLRSQGVPARIIFGYVGTDDQVYHAWNMYYTEEAGWVAVEFKVDPDDWNRMDLTFSANGEDSKFIGDGSNYTDVFVY